MNNDFYEIVGTCMSNAEIQEKYSLDESDDVEDVLIEFNIERCKGCEWWFESGELTPDEDDEGDSENLIGFCRDCRTEMLEN